MTAPYDPLHDIHAQYGAAVRLALTSINTVYRAVSLEREELFDAEWNRASLAPLATLGRVRLSRYPLHRLLHVIARQAAWPEEGFEPQPEALALAVEP
jgi:hypothetical protein